MNYKSIIAKAIEENKTQKTPYSTYFKREAKKNKEIEHEEFNDFFDGCKYIISLYKKEIEGQLRKDINEEISDHNNSRRMLEIAKGIDFDGNSEFELLRQKMENIVDFLSDKHADNSQYKCCIRSDNGEIVKNDFFGHLKIYNDDHITFKYDIFDLTYLEVIGIEEELVDVEKAFVNKNNPFSFRSFLKCDEDIKDKVILFIRNEIENSTKINFTMATITFALQKKKYLYYDNQTIYHKALKDEFGKVGQRNKFSERYGECNLQNHDIILHYVNNLP